MPASKYISWELDEHTTTHETRATDWELQRVVMPAGKMTAGAIYMIYTWANCFSPGTQDGGTKWAFVGGGDLPGSTQERYDTNSSGMAICHLGTFTAAATPLPIGIYRKILVDNSQNEVTKAGQCFLVDVSSHVDNQIEFPFKNVDDYTLREVGIGGVLESITVDLPGNTQYLVLGTAKVRGGDGTPTKLGLYHEGTLVSSGSRYSVDSQDNNQVVLGGLYNVSSGDVFQVRNIDESTSATTNYTYMAALNLGAGANTCDTGRLTTWTDLGGSGRWTPTTAASDAGNSFVFAFARQQATGIGNGRQASISIKNNTQGNWMAFPDRPSGDFSSLYFPATEVGVNVGQYSTAAVVGSVGADSPITSGDEIQVYTI